MHSTSMSALMDNFSHISLKHLTFINIDLFNILNTAKAPSTWSDFFLFIYFLSIFLTWSKISTPMVSWDEWNVNVRRKQGGGVYTCNQVSQWFLEWQPTILSRMIIGINQYLATWKREREKGKRKKKHISHNPTTNNCKMNLLSILNLLFQHIK